MALAEEAGRDPMPPTCRPPPPVEPFEYGDLVPLGFLLRTIAAYTEGTSPVRQGLEALLRGKRQGLLWPYHSGTLVTCIDSALVLQGFRDPAGVEAREAFADGLGGYSPQLCSERPERGKMTITPRNRHWCQPEYGTTCLVTALRAQNGLRRKTDAAYLEAGYENRGGLYFANPYMVDWALAWALQGTASATELRERLATDVLASMNEDGSFGRYDVPMSTALAILSLVSLSAADEAVHRARLRLADLMMADGLWPSGTPFYSSVTVPRERFSGGTLARLMLGRRQGQLVWLSDAVHAISFYEDRYRVISTSLAVLALTLSGPPVERDTAPPTEDRDGCHPRY
ncbi:MAG: hypothetical protein ACRDTR_21750, partial [Rubrobacter sp.]